MGSPPLTVYALAHSPTASARINKAMPKAVAQHKPVNRYSARCMPILRLALDGVAVPSVCVVFDVVFIVRFSFLFFLFVTTYPVTVAITTL